MSSFDFISAEGKSKFLSLAFKNTHPSSVRIKAFTEYLERIGVSSFIIEDNYIDKDYLKDYANYYARCFVSYGHICKRIHFFKNKYSLSDIERILEDINECKSQCENIKNDYLGFMVIKPIPTPIGKTCLQIYPESDFRKYPTVRKYSVNLFGIDLSIDSLAYQEQDGAVAVCATSSLWSAAQKTSQLFQHKLPAPSEITKLCTSQTNYTRSFPNNGLTAEQLGVGISELGLEPQIFTHYESRINKMFIYAYCKSGIPIICGLSLYEVNSDNKLTLYAEHSVTVTGYSFEGGEAEIYQSNEINLKSSQMTRIFCHDDQLCPFARMKFDPKFYYIDKAYRNQMILTSWRSSENDLPIVAKIDAILVPLYNKIRISLSSVYLIIGTLEAQLREVVNRINDALSKRSSKNRIEKRPFQWDVFLSSVNDFKREILQMDSNKLQTSKKEVLLQDLPKYMWRAIASIDNEKQFEILFDATDIERGKIYLNRIDYSSNLFDLIHSLKIIITDPRKEQRTTYNKSAKTVYLILKDLP